MKKIMKSMMRVMILVLIFIIDMVEIACKKTYSGLVWVWNNPWTCVRESLKFILALAMGELALFWLFSLKWSIDDMSILERICAVVYFIIGVPLYFGIISGCNWIVKGLANRK